MEQSVITQDTLGFLVEKAGSIIDRPLTEMEKTLMEFALDYVRLGLVEVK
jgi:hypothetical protein